MIHRAVYAAYDLYPSSKGAATHIGHMASTMFRRFDGGVLLTLGSSFSAANEFEGDVEARRHCAPIANYLDRAQSFASFVYENMQTLPDIRLAHFRDIWSGLGLLQVSGPYKALFEVNGLPSIELPYHYPNLSPQLIEKISKLESFCFEQADHIIAPSNVIKNHLMGRGVADQKIDVVTNAANTIPVFGNVVDAPDEYILYFGALQSWQGVDVLLKAFSLLKDKPNLKLMLCCAGKPRLAKPFQRIARRLGIEQSLIWKHQIVKSELNCYINNALLTVAPLTECSRNVIQGCSPLKIFESMACSTPVIASRLPVTEEIIEDGVSGKLVRADRPQELARAIRLLLEYPDLSRSFAEKARVLIQEKYNWPAIEKQMLNIYEDCLNR